MGRLAAGPPATKTQGPSLLSDRRQQRVGKRGPQPAGVGLRPHRPLYLCEFRRLDNLSVPRFPTLKRGVATVPTSQLGRGEESSLVLRAARAALQALGFS